MATTPTIDAGALAAYLNLTDVPAVADAFATAVGMVTRYIGEAPVPVEVVDRACVEVGAALYRRKLGGFSGGTQFGTAEGTATMYARDPMVTVYPLLDRWLSGGFA